MYQDAGARWNNGRGEVSPVFAIVIRADEGVGLSEDATRVQRIYHDLGGGGPEWQRVYGTPGNAPVLRLLNVVVGGSVQARGAARVDGETLGGERAYGLPG